MSFHLPRFLFIDNTTLNVGTGGDSIRDKDRAGVKTQIFAIDLNPAGAETLMAGSMPVTISTDADNTSTGTLSAAAQTVVLVIGGKSASSISISGTWAGTITFEGSVDGTIWNSINAVAASTSAPQSTTTVNGLYRLTPAGLLQIRVNMTTFGSGSASIFMRVSAGTGGVFANQILPSKITDGTNTATIKAASTAVVASDIPLVIALHPTSPTPNFVAAQAVTIAATVLTDPSDRSARLLGITSIKGLAIASQTTNFAAAGVGNTTGLDVSAAANVTFIIKNTVAATAWTGTPTIIFEQSDDNVSWGVMSVVRNDSGLSASTHTLPANTANTSYMFDCAAEGNFFVRARVTVGTATGGLTIVVQPGSLPFSPTVTAVLNPETTKVIGTVNLPSPPITYTSVTNGVVPAATATDLVTIYGSATKTINILNIYVTGVQTTAGQIQILLIKRSTANTVGTSTAQTRIPYDSNDVASTATVLAYTANPTLGTAIGNVRGDRAFLPGAASAGDAQGLAWSFVNGKPMILRGIAQGVCINLAGATLAGGSLNVTIEWTET